MTKYTADPKHVVSDAAALRALYPKTHDLAALKCLTALDAHAIDFIRRAPFVCLGTQDLDGRADVSPRGDPIGFVKVLDAHTLAIPDRPGNNRLDSLANIIANPTVGLLFLIPGFEETLRVNGQAQLVIDPNLLETLAVNDRSPKTAIVVSVTEAFLHCAKALRRSRLWEVEQQQDRKEMPSLMQILLDQTTGAPKDVEEMKALDDGLETAYKKSMY